MRHRFAPTAMSVLADAVLWLAIALGLVVIGDLGWPLVAQVFSDAAQVGRW